MDVPLIIAVFLLVATFIVFGNCSTLYIEATDIFTFSYVIFISKLNIGP